MLLVLLQYGTHVNLLSGSTIMKLLPDFLSRWPMPARRKPETVS